MLDLPVMLKIAQNRCVVAGGGPTAARRAAALIKAGGNVVVISPQFSQLLRQLQSVSPALSLVERGYEPGDLQDAFLVVIATDDPGVNRQIAADAQQSGVLCNRADEPDEGQLTFMAQAHHGPVTLAVHTSGISAGASAAIRDEISSKLSPHWETMLTAAASWRAKIQSAITSPPARRMRLLALTNAAAIHILQSQGLEALNQYYASLADPSAPEPALADREPS